MQNQDRNLIAVHNLTANELEKTFNLGGFPMPSIAVTKDDYSHTEYGEVSVLFSRDTIDPKVNQNNKIYGGDAWTPTYLKIEHKINYKKASGIYSKANTIGNIPFFNPVNLHPDIIEDMIIRFNLYKLCMR